MRRIASGPVDEVVHGGEPAPDLRRPRGLLRDGTAPSRLSAEPLRSPSISDYTLRTVALGSAALGIDERRARHFAVLRRQSLLGDAISHAALPGIALAFLLTGSKAPLVLVLGAALAGFARRRSS